MKKRISLVLIWVMLGEVFLPTANAANPANYLTPDTVLEAINEENGNFFMEKVAIIVFTPTKSSGKTLEKEYSEELAELVKNNCYGNCFWCS